MSSWPISAVLPWCGEIDGLPRPFWTPRLRRGRVVAVVIIAMAAAGAGRAQTVSPPIWTVPEVGALPDDDHGRLVRRGRDLITATYAHIGPEVPDPAKRFAGNNLACGNCHLETGTKRFGLPLFGLVELFPQYSARLGAEITIEERVNSCMTRSMNGRALPIRQARNAGHRGLYQIPVDRRPAGQAVAGLGTGTMPELDAGGRSGSRPAIYANACLSCHNTDGSGIRRSLPTVDLGYMVPPLWGADSFNDGAGMARLITAANFVHFNMPHGTDYLDPQLTVEQAWDVAAYLISQPRPPKPGLPRIFPTF